MTTTASESAEKRPCCRGGWKWILRLVILPAALVLIVLLGCNLWVVGSSRNSVYDDVSGIRQNDVGLVLGTAKKIAPDRANYHFVNRVEAAAALYKGGKVRHLLVSGDNATIYYNEPRDMTEALVLLGVPKKAITSDYAGFRTFDSVVRAQKVFGLEEFTIISDGFHVPRAVFLARSQGLDVVALASREVAFGVSLKARAREWLARVQAVLDVYVFGTRPKFLGEPVAIPIGAEKVSVKSEGEKEEAAGVGNL